MSAFNPRFPSTTMEQAPLYCRDCKTSKPRDQFKLRKRDDKYGRKGEPTSKCSHCTTRNENGCQALKRKRNEEGLDPAEDPPEPDPTISIEQFTTMLHDRALSGDLCCRMRVSTQGLAGEEAEVVKVIVGRVREATGFRFTYG